MTPPRVATLDLGTAVLSTVVVGPMGNNAYAITCSATGTSLLIDPAAEPQTVLSLLTGDSYAEMIVVTHRHLDHTGALAEVAAATGAVVAAGDADADAITAGRDVAIGQRLVHGDSLTIGELRLQVVALRGHTPGSVALALRTPAHGTHLFTGDSLFPGGVGKTTTAQDFVSLIEDVTDRIFSVYDDAAHVHPGHGASTTLGVERPQLNQWRIRGW